MHAQVPWTLFYLRSACRFSCWQAFSGAKQSLDIKQDAKTPRHQDTKTPRHQDAKTPRHQDAKTPRHQDVILITNVLHGQGDIHGDQNQSATKGNGHPDGQTNLPAIMPCQRLCKASFGVIWKLLTLLVGFLVLVVVLCIVLTQTKQLQTP